MLRPKRIFVILIVALALTTAATAGLAQSSPVPVGERPSAACLDPAALGVGLMSGVAWWTVQSKALSTGVLADSPAVVLPALWPPGATMIVGTNLLWEPEPDPDDPDQDADPPPEDPPPGDPPPP